MTAELYAGTGFAGDIAAKALLADGRAMFAGVPAPGVAPDDFSMRIRSRFTATETGVHTFTLAQAGGSARVTADGVLLLDSATVSPGAGTESSD